MFIHLRHELELVHCDDVVHFSNLWIWFVACRRIGQLRLRICVFNGKFNLTGSCSRADRLKPPPFLVSRNYCIWIPSSAQDDAYVFFFAENPIKSNKFFCLKKKLTNTLKKRHDYQSILGMHYLISSITTNQH